ncbi:hypothetical protein RCH18_002656 [Flavobacterium sp. PL11]|uniref:hypothetical protein n=1 Tax=Flavobacterium sp. PL11 TaxID=3071717 RepID=UPI002DFBF30C|nr:hypothetical protein [Flavobacterium sp. PL11]
MKYTALILTTVLLFGCNSKKEDAIDTIGSSFVTNIVDKDIPLSNSTYSNEAIEILEKHRTKLKSFLPQILASEVNIYKNTLIEIEKIPALTYTLAESNLLNDKVRKEAGVTLINKEIELNQTYFELFNELSILNLKYNSLKKDEFEDFYDAGPIVLSDEIMIKIDELVKDEDTRVELEKANNRKEMVFSAILIIPGTSACKGILGGLTQAAKAFKTGKELSSKSSYLAKGSYQLMNKEVANFISKSFKNDGIRSKVSKLGYVGPVTSATRLVTNNTANYISAEESTIVFKVIENKINGRIGDFSDGILAVHMQRVRDLIKKNAEKVKA